MNSYYRKQAIAKHVLPVAARLLLDQCISIGVPIEPLKKVVDLNMGQSPRGASYNTDGFGMPFIGGPADLGRKYPQTRRWTSEPTKTCQPGDIIICVRATIGKPRWSDGEYCLGRGVAGLRPKSSRLNSRFLFRCLVNLEEELQSKGTGTTFKTVSKRHIEALPIPLPNPEYQELIADYLDWLEARSEAHESVGDEPRLPTLFDEQRRIVACIEELATLIEEAQGLRVKAREEAEALASSALSQMFDYQTPDRLPGGWVWRPFRELLIDDKEGMKTGPFGTLLQKSEIQSEGVPVLGIANVQTNRFVPGFTDYVSPEKAEQLSSYELRGGDIVVARSGTVGRSCVVPSGFDPAPIMSTNLIRLRLDTQVFLPELLSRLFNGSRLVERHKESECRGSTRSFFTQRILLKLRIPVPPLPEQRRIVAYLDDLQAQMGELTALQDATQAEMDALLPSILDKAFKGEL